MRWLFVMVLGACGRFGFDAEVLATSDAPSADARTAPCTGPDEDSDGWPDACDNCPSERNVDQQDGGEVSMGLVADGVGDACDPRPFATGDRIFMFDPFEAPDDDRYTYYGMNSYLPGVLRLGQVPAGEGQAFFDIPLTVTRIDVAFTVVASSSTEVQWAGVWTDLSPDGELKLFNEASYDPQASQTQIRMKEDAGGNDRYSADISDVAPWRTATPYRMVLDTDSTTGGDYLLTAQIGSDAPRTTTLNLLIPRGEEAFLEAEGMVCDFAYVTVYQR